MADLRKLLSQWRQDCFEQRQVIRHISSKNEYVIFEVNVWPTINQTKVFGYINVNVWNGKNSWHS